MWSVRHFLSDFNHIWNFYTDFHKVPNIQFQVNPSKESGTDTCGQTDGQQFSRIMVFNVAGNYKIYLGVHVKCPISLLDFNQIWMFLTDFHKSSRYQFSQKSAQLEQHWCMRMDRLEGRDEGNRRFFATVLMCLTSQCVRGLLELVRFQVLAAVNDQIGVCWMWRHVVW